MRAARAKQMRALTEDLMVYISMFRRQHGTQWHDRAAMSLSKRKGAIINRGIGQRLEKHFVRMRHRGMLCAFLPFLALWPITTLAASGTAIPQVARWAVDMVVEETIGPFASWSNAKRDYGAIGDGVADDTGTIQSALNDLGRVGKAQVLYIPPGTYKITSTLNLTGSAISGSNAFGWGGVGIIGDHPATTIIKWAGPSGGAMLVQNGGLGTRYSRLTWDGSGTAGYGVAQWWNTSAGGLYGGSTEHQDEVFQDVNIGIMAGRMGAQYGQLDSEGQVRRVSFIRNRYAGLDTGSWNALDWWVWDSHFVDCARGVANTFSVNDAGVTTGAGAVYVYRSFFERSTVADMQIANTGWFSMHNNVSIGSRRFFEAAPMGSNAAVSILQNNRVVQSTDPVPVSLGNLGPLFLIDNQVQSTTSTYNLTDWVAGRDVLSLGNHVTAGPPSPSGSDRLLSIDDVNVSASSISTQPMALPPTPAWTTHQIFEVPTGATADQIQAIIDQSAQSSDPQPIVHFGHSTWTLNKSLNIPKNRAIQLVGDGYGSILSWFNSTAAGPMVGIAAPAKVTVRDMQWLGVGSGGVGATTAINISGADQPGGRIQIVGSTPGPIKAQHLEMTQLSLQANPGINSISLDDVIHAVAMGTGGIGPVQLTNNSNFLMADTWYEGSDTALFRMDSATFTYLGGHLARGNPPGATNLADPSILLDQFSGQASWIGMQLDLSAIPSGIEIQIDSENAQTQVYFMGVTSDKPNYFDWGGNNTGLGTIGFILNRTLQGTAAVQADNQGSTSAGDIRETWNHARSLNWDSAPYQVPMGSTDVRVYHMKMDQTTGLVIQGQ